MKLYVCWSTNPKFAGATHACGAAYEALREAGHDPDVIRAKGFGRGPDARRGKTAQTG